MGTRDHYWCVGTRDHYWCVRTRDHYWCVGTRDHAIHGEARFMEHVIPSLILGSLGYCQSMENKRFFKLKKVL